MKNNSNSSSRVYCCSIINTPPLQLDDNKRREEEENEQINAMLSAKGITSDRYNYNTESFITIDSLLEV